MTQLPSDHVRVRNLGKRHIESAYNSLPYTIPANGDALIPREAACKDFGNWDARGRERYLEVKRLRGLYGALEGMANEEELWEKNRPQVEVYDAEGERIVTVLDDPEGKDLPAVGGSVSESASVIDAMRAQMRQMQERIDAMSSDGPSVPEDDPIPKPRRRKEAPFEPAREA